MLSADEEADSIMKNAVVSAQRRSDKIVEEAKEKADDMIRQAESEARLEMKKAQAGIKKEIVNMSYFMMR